MPQFKNMIQDPTQLMLIPLSLDEKIAEDDEVRLLSEVMDKLDWSILESTYNDRGTPAYPPRVMVMILVFAYSRGVFSSRKIDEMLQNDIRFMWIAGMLNPDFRTIARFRKEKYEALAELFADSVRLCKESGLVSLNITALDGTKIGANASRKSLYESKYIAKELEAARKILQEAEEIDALEDKKYGDSNGREIPEHLRNAEARKAFLEELGKKLAENKRKYISSTDEECRMMKTRDGIIPSYNVQAAVDEKNQVVVAMDVTNSENDFGQMPQMVEKIIENCGIEPVMVLADKGYSDNDSLKRLDEMEQEALIALSENQTNTKVNDLFSSRCFISDENEDVLICPAGRKLFHKGVYKFGSDNYRLYSATGCSSCSFRNQCVKAKKGSRRVSIRCDESSRIRMKDKLKRSGSKIVYELRKQIVEPVFGQIKQNRNFRRFSLRGLNGALSEAALIFLCHNLSKCALKST